MEDELLNIKETQPDSSQLNQKSVISGSSINLNKFFKTVVFLLIILIFVGLSFYIYGKFLRPIRPLQEGEEDFKSVEDWCLNSQEWFTNDTCGGYVSIDSPVFVFIDKSGKLKGKCGWEDNDCPFKQCQLYGESDKQSNICLVNKSADYCERVTSESKKSSCYYYFSKVNKDKSICYGVLNKMGQKDLCLKEFATNNRNVVVCKEISDKEIRNQCIGTFVQSSSDCVIYGDDKAINECYDKYYLEFQTANNEILNKALSTDDMTKCSGIKGARFREICTLRFAFKDDRPELCRNLTNKQFIDECKNKFPNYFKSN